MLAEPILVVAQVAQVLESLGIEYAVGGSLASSVYGTPRATADVDLVAKINAAQVEPLARGLGRYFYVDIESIAEAVRRKASFNALHSATAFKADIFVSKDDAWSREELRRARLETFETAQGPRTVRFASPEDTLLHKLVWYRLGNEISDRQWIDILGIFEIQGSLLDDEYLNRWAAHLEVADLLARARSPAQDEQSDS